MKSTVVDTSQFRDPAGQVAGEGEFLTTPTRAFSRLASAAFGLLLGVQCVVNAQQYSFATIDVPGATRTSATGNSTTAVVGEFDDANGNTHGFVSRHGTFTTIDVPGVAGQIQG